MNQSSNEPSKQSNSQPANTKKQVNRSTEQATNQSTQEGIKQINQAIISSTKAKQVLRPFAYSSYNGKAPRPKKPRPPTPSAHGQEDGDGGSSYPAHDIALRHSSTLHHQAYSKSHRMRYHLISLTCCQAVFARPRRSALVTIASSCTPHAPAPTPINRTVSSGSEEAQRAQRWAEIEER